MMRKSFIIVLMALTTLLQADYILEYQMENDIQKFMYHSSTRSKMINHSDRDKSEIYKIGKKIYIVTDDNGKKNIVDVDDIRKMSKSMGFDASQYIQKQEKPKYKIKKTGKRVKVGGISGEIWVVSGTYNGEKFKDKIVVTKDKRVIKAIHAMYSMLGSIGGASVDDSFLEVQKGYVTIKADGMKLKSFSNKRIASSEYQLPKNAKKQQMPNIKKIKKDIVDSCYNKVCCGKTAGESKVLKSALNSSFKGYKLIGNGICDTLGFSSIFAQNSIEGALYKKGNRTIQITLNMNDTDGGIIRKTKKNLDSGHSAGMVKSIKNYTDNTSVQGCKLISATLMPMRQTTYEYIINSKTTLTISYIGKRIDFKYINGLVDLITLKKNLKVSKSAKKADKSITNDVDVDDAVNLLKSFF